MIRRIYEINHCRPDAVITRPEILAKPKASSPRKTVAKIVNLFSDLRAGVKGDDEVRLTLLLVLKALCARSCSLSESLMRLAAIVLVPSGSVPDRFCSRNENERSLLKS